MNKNNQSIQKFDNNANHWVIYLISCLIMPFYKQQLDCASILTRFESYILISAFIHLTVWPTVLLFCSRQVSNGKWNRINLTLLASVVLILQIYKHLYQLDGKLWNTTRLSLFYLKCSQVPLLKTLLSWR